MARVTSQRTRQALLVVGEHTDPFILPEKLELYDELGDPVDLLKDRSRLRWAGVWQSDLVYEINDLVYYQGFLWVAPGDIEQGITPGIGYSDPDVGVNRGVMFKQSDRLVSTDDVLYTIGPPPGQRRDNDISVGYSAAVLLDRTGAIASGTNLVITPVSRSSSGGMSAAIYDSGNGLITVINWSQAEVDSHTPKSFDMGGMSGDRYVHVYFSGGTDGSFMAHVTSATNLEAPPVVGNEWDVVIAQIPIGGTTGQRLVKASNTDYDTEWVTPTDVLPPGGTTDQLLAKASGTDGDTDWIDPPTSLPAGGATSDLLAKASSSDGDAHWVVPPHDLPVGGASGYLLAKASGSDRDVGWVAPPHDLPVGGATGYVLAKNSGTDRDVGWVAQTPRDMPVGGSTGQVLAKNSGTDRDVGWVAQTPRDMPVGGSTGQVLAKNSGTDRDVGWTTNHDVPAGGTTGQVLSKNSGTDYDASWAAASGGGTDREKYRGEWDSTVAYSQHDVVAYKGGIYIAPAGGVSAGVAPGVLAKNELITTPPVRGVRGWAIDRLASTSDVVRNIPVGAEITDISTNKSARLVVVDKTASVAGPNVTLTNNHASVNLAYAVYDSNNGFQSLAGTGIAPGASVTFTLPTGTTDMFIVVYFETVGATGNFSARVSSNTNLVAPPTLTPWVRIGSTSAISEELLVVGPNISAGNEGSVTHTHNLGIPNLGYTISGHLEDGSWAHACNWRIINRTADAFTAYFRNFHSSSTAQPNLRCRLIY